MSEVAPAPPSGLLGKLRVSAGSVLAEKLFYRLAELGALHPRARPEVHGVEVLKDLSYAPTGREAHRLDVWRPKDVRGPLPVVLYVHGGGFRILSKDTHWVMALGLARAGYLVFNVNYRLAPEHPFPAAIEDVCTAYHWVSRNLARFGGDPSRFVLAGESAGANLVTSLALAACFERPEPHARAVFDTGLVPRAVAPACGLLQVSDPQRFARRKRIHPVIQDRIDEVSWAYLGAAERELPGGLGLADPLVVLEGDAPSARPLPAFFAGVGTADPLLDDTRRLHTALRRRGVRCEARYYPGEVHAFHAFVWRKHAREYWREQLEFLAEHTRPVAQERATSAVR